MKDAIKPTESPAPVNEPCAAPMTPPDYALNIVGVYQDSVTRQWAEESFQQATQLAGEDRIQDTWYKTDTLNNPAIFLEAVSATVIADVIVVSIYAADELPLDLYVWFDAWLPRRLSRVGALAAVVGVAEPLPPHAFRTFDYLQAVARKAQLEFILQERRRPEAFPASPVKAVVERAHLVPPFHPDLPGLFDGVKHNGLRM